MRNHCRIGNVAAWVALAVAIVAMVSRAPAPNIDPFLVEDNRLATGVLLYDTDGNAGGARKTGLGEGSREVFWTGGYPVPDHVFGNLNLTTWNLFTFFPQETPFYLRAELPNGECFGFAHASGMGYTLEGSGSSTYPIWIIPASYEEQEIAWEPEWTDGDPGLASSIHFNVVVADTLTTATLGMLAEYLPDSRSRMAHITVQYLEGNDLEAELQDQVSMPLNRRSAGSPQEPSVIWASTSAQSLHPIPPVGPVRVTIAVDGYGQSQIEYSLEAGPIYEWYPILVPDGTDPTATVPSALFPNAEILGYSQLDALFGTCTPAANLAGPTDANNDGVRDAADMVRLKVEE